VFACAEVEIAAMARKVRNAVDDSSETVASGTEKKSSFATDQWLAQCEAAKKPATSEQVDMFSSEDAGESNGAIRNLTGEKWTSSNWSNVDAISAPSQSTECHLRSRSRSPLDSTKLHRSRSPRSQVEHLRQLEVELEQQSKRHSAYISEAKSSLQHHKSYDRERSPPDSNSNLRQTALKSALKQRTGSAAATESYSTKYGRQQEVLSGIHRHEPIDRNADLLSQIKGVSR